MSDPGMITTEMIAAYQNHFQNEPKSTVIRNAIAYKGIDDITINRDSVIGMRNVFSEEIQTGKITAQEKSGRCWIFAGMNVLRLKVAQKIGVKDFELSQSYAMFYDKLEKANFLLESVIETRDEETNSRVVMWLMEYPIVDGGQWTMFENLIRKYGAVPKSAMPETYHSGNSFVMNKLLALKLRELAKRLRDSHRSGKTLGNLREEKETMLSEIYRMLSYFLGEPPKRFDFEYRDDDKKFFAERGLTPHTFYEKYVDFNPDDYISIVNAPTSDKPFLRTYTVQFLGNVYEGAPVLYLNLDQKSFKDLAVKQLQSGEPVWFGCDVRQWLNMDTGILDTQLFGYEEAMGIRFETDKAFRLDYGESKLTHAMVFTGVNLVEGKPNRWKVENSWGEDKGQDGFLVMSDDWFDQFTYQIVVNKRHLSPEQASALKTEPVMLKPWDPLGALA